MSGKSDDMYNVPLSSDSDIGESSLGGKIYTNQSDIRHSTLGNSSSLESDINADEEEEKQRLVTQVLELQNTLDDLSSHLDTVKEEKLKSEKQVLSQYIENLMTANLSSRVDTVKEENLKLKSENQVLGQYIENLMTASSVFQSTSPKSKKKSGKKKDK